jgi:hypothetical protein
MPIENGNYYVPCEQYSSGRFCPSNYPRIRPALIKLVKIVQHRERFCCMYFRDS